MLRFSRFNGAEFQIICFPRHKHNRITSFKCPHLSKCPIRPLKHLLPQSMSLDGSFATTAVMLSQSATTQTTSPQITGRPTASPVQLLPSPQTLSSIPQNPLRRLSHTHQRNVGEQNVQRRNVSNTSVQILMSPSSRLTGFFALHVTSGSVYAPTRHIALSPGTLTVNLASLKKCQ